MCISLVFSSYGPPVYVIPESVRIKYYWLGLKSFLHRITMTDDKFRCSFISAYSSVVPDTLVDLPRNRNTCYKMPINSILPPFSECFHPSENFPLVHNIAILNCLSLVSNCQ